MSSAMDAVSCDKQLAYIKIEVLRSKTVTEIHDALIEACGTYALSFNMVYRWVSRFNTGRTDVSDEPRSGRHLTVTDRYHVER